ncbi:aspartate aminotransferase family protein [Nostoc sp. 3335mG]|nr:aspartate aminotransferase family protein [Nostoc sp. 3335mG]
MNNVVSEFDGAFWEAANRHMLRYGGHGGEFIDFVPERAQGVWLYDRAGRKMLDFTSGQMSSILGHSHPEVVETLREAAGNLDHLYSFMLSKPAVDLAVALAELVPELPRVMLLSTGSESNDAALRIAKMVTGKWEVAGFAQSWHGNTGTSAASSYAAARRGQGPLTPGNYAIPAPNSFKPRFPGVTWQQELDDSFDLLDRQSTGNLAAFIAEPILSAGGILELPIGYLAALKAHCQRRGMLLILDEAQTGLGRLGDMFGFDRDKTAPDILTLSKTLGAGMALSAVMTSDETAAAAEERGFFFTTTHVNDPLTASVGNKVVEIVRRDSLDQRARVLGGRLKAGLQNFMQRYQCIADVRGRGLLLGMQFVEYNGNSAAVMSERVIRTATKLGLLANNSGASLSGGIMRIAPPLTSTDEEIDAGIDILNAALKEVCE